MRFRAATLLVVALMTTVPAAARYDFVLTVDGKRLADGDICFFPMGPVRNGLMALLASGDVRCLPADLLIDMRRGRWSYFARHADGYVSVHRGRMSVATESGEDTYSQQKMTMVPAAYVDFARVLPDLEAGERLAVIVGETPGSLSTVLPLVPGEAKVAVPAGARVLPLRVRDSSITGVGQPLTLESGKTATATFERVGDTVAVVAQVSFGDDALDSEVPSYLRQLVKTEPPRIELRHRDGIRQPVLPTFFASDLHNALQIFTGVPRGQAVVTLGGPTWRAATQAVTIAHDTPAVVSVGPIITTPLAAIDADVRVPSLADSAATSAAACGASSSKSESPLEVTISKCAAGEIEVGRCGETIATHRPEVGHPVSFAAIEPGTYALRARYGPARAAKVVEATMGRVTSETLDLDVFSFTGSIRLGERALHATIDFYSGEATSDPVTGEYVALLSAAPGLEAFRVRSCDGTVATNILPAAPPARHGRFDIVLPDNALAVRVVDGSTGERVRAATVRYGVFERRDSERPRTWRPVATEDGETTLRHLPEAWIKVCAQAEGYPLACNEPLQVTGKTSESVTIRLARANRNGRVRTQGRIEKGLLFLMAGDGSVLERVDIAADGRFSYRSEGGFAYAVFTATSHPLFATHNFSANADELLLDLPHAASRTIRVQLSESSPRRHAYVGLVINGLPIPGNALGHHQQWRGQPHTIRDRVPVEIRDILQNGPLDVLLGPEPGTLTGLPTKADIFAMPHLRVTFPATRVGDDGVVVLGQ